MSNTTNMKKVAEQTFYSVVKPDGVMVTDHLDDTTKGDGSEYCLINCHTEYQSAYNECVAKLFALALIQEMIVFIPEKLKLGKFYTVDSLNTLHPTDDDFVNCYAFVAELAVEIFMGADRSDLTMYPPF